MVPPHSHAMRIKKAALSKRLMGYILLLIPARTFRTVGARMRMNAAVRGYFAYSVARVSRMTVTLIWPG